MRTDSWTKVAPGFNAWWTSKTAGSSSYSTSIRSQRFFSRVHVQRRHSRHRITHVAHFLHGDDGLIFKYRTIVRLDAFVVENVIARNHRQDPGNFERFGSVDMS